RVGPVFVFAMKEKTGMDAAAITRAYAITRRTFRLRDQWAGIEALDNRVPAALQVSMFVAASELAEAGTLWVLRHGSQPLDIAAHIEAYGPGVAAFNRALEQVLAPADAAALAESAAHHEKQGVPPDLARSLASLHHLAAGLDVVRLAQATRRPVS